MPTNPGKMLTMAFGGLVTSLLLLLVANVVWAGRPAPAHFFHNQLVDHLNLTDSNNKTMNFWTQRYYVWEEHFQGPGHPIFLILGGEGNVEPSTGIFYPFISDHLAKDFGAYVLQPEHRFYGRSQPLARRRLPRTKVMDEDARVGLLTSEQALLDAIRLLRHVQVNLECNILDRTSAKYCPVISVGGSYPGFLSAMARILYPEVIDMSYAASAPLKFYAQQVDSKAYYQHITKVADQCLPGCARSVHQTLYKAMSWIQNQSSQKLPQISKALGICPCTLPSYITNTSLLAKEVLMMIGYTFANDNMAFYPPNSNGTRLLRACQVFSANTHATTATSIATINVFLVSQLASERAQTLKQRGKKKPPFCFDMQQQMPSGPRATISSGDWSGVGSGTSGDSWDFQTCTLLVEAIGFDGTMFYPPRQWSLEWLQQHCLTRFGVKPDPYRLVKAWRFDDLGHYGNVSRILFTNGLNDGWSVGSILTNLSDSLIALNFPNGAHHSDLSGKGPSDDDTEDIKQGFNTIRSILQTWLGELKSNRNSDAEMTASHFSL